MPGVVMEQNGVGGRGPDLHDQINGASSASKSKYDHSGSPDELQNGSLRSNGAQNSDLRHNPETSPTKMASLAAKDPPELQHIAQGFFPLSKLVNRSVQQCWNDLAELVNELAEIPVSAQEANTSPGAVIGRVPGNQSPENLRKKVRAFEFAQSKRGEFIKLLVLSQWSRQAADVSKLIDIQNFIRIQHQAYAGALQWMGDMKRDLVRAQVANPDIRTALEVLSKSEVVSMPDLGYKLPKPLTSKSTLRKLRNLNRSISARLALHENIPVPFQTYQVHDGRVTFVVPGQFELDLSIGEEDFSSQFFFVDFRFLFSPSPSVPAGRMFSELDLKINETLRSSGLPGCFYWLHNLTLTNKISILTRQALELTRSVWSNVLRVELLHRTLVLQYWASKAGTKSWLEIGIRRGVQKGTPSLGLRWMREGQEVDSQHIEFDTENLSLERLLRSVIALHISHVLSSVFGKINGKLLYSNGSLSLRAHLTKTEPADCQLDIQLTSSRRLRVAIEPMSGAVILAATPNTLERVDTDRSMDRPIIDDIVTRVGRLRSAAAIEEVESQVTMLGFETINPRNAKIDSRRIFPANVLRFSFFSHRLWERTWLLAATSSMDADSWWVVQSRQADPATVTRGSSSSADNNSAVRSAQVICNTLVPVHQSRHSSLANIGHSLSGILAIYANARFLEDLQAVKILPHLEQLKIGPTLQVPDINIEYDASKLPQALQLDLPVGLKKRTFVQNTVRLTFKGVDRHRNAAIMVVYGNLSTPFQAIGELIAEDDPSLAFQKTGTGFALRLFASPGYPIIITILENLQRLECVLTIYELLRQKKMFTRSLSLSHIGFAYGPARNLLAQLDIETQPHLPTETDPTKLASKRKRMFQLRLGITFDRSNPHRRIQEPLASSLNRSGTDTGLKTLAELLLFTLPLMQALDSLAANRTHNEPVKVHIIVHNAMSFLIHYPFEKCRFQLVAHQHQGQPVWILKDAPSPRNGPGENQLKHKLQESLYNSKGAGWRGLGNGVIAQPDHVVTLLNELDKCLASMRTDLASKTSDSKVVPGAPAVNNQTPAPGPGLDGRGAGGNNRNVQPNAAGAQKTDVIMID